MEDTVIQSFRTAVGGFHKGDVMNYISHTAEKHEKELKEKERYIAELTAENQLLREKIDALNESFAQLCLAPQTRQQPQGPAKSEKPESVEASNLNEQELAAYRRAERAERSANARAKKQYQKLAEFTAEVEHAYDDSEMQARKVLDVLGEQITALKAIQERLSSTAEDCRARAEQLSDVDFENN